MTSVTLNAGIGDLILSHAMLAATIRTPIEVRLSSHACHSARGGQYFPFAWKLFEHLFKWDDRFVIKGHVDEPGIDPLTLARLGFRPTRPMLAKPYDGVYPNSHVVHTKVRGLERSCYEAIRPRFLAALWRLPEITLLGEKTMTIVGEYENKKSKVYSIYDDVKDLPNVAFDYTRDELLTRPDFNLFLVDCHFISSSAYTICLGSGGNTAMAMAYGTPLGFTRGTEYGAFYEHMAGNPFCREEEGFLLQLESLQ